MGPLPILLLFLPFADSLPPILIFALFETSTTMFQMTTKFSSLTFFSIVVSATATQCKWKGKTCKALQMPDSRQCYVSGVPACLWCERASRCTGGATLCDTPNENVFRTA